MDPTDFDIFDRVDKRMHWLDQRQSLLAQDIANSNTPSFPLASQPAVMRPTNENTVATEDQLGRPAETSCSQDLVAHLYHKYKSMFELVLGRSS